MNFVKKKKMKFNGLDHLRAVAILLVLLYHYRMFAHPAWIDSYANVLCRPVVGNLRIELRQFRHFDEEAETLF